MASTLFWAAADGVVLSSSLEAGATVAAGQGVFQLSSEDRQHAVFYLPQDCLSQVAVGDELPLFLQGSQEEAARGRVTYIDLQAVYPPEDYENDSNRNQRSVKINVELTCGGPFAIGQPLFLRLAASRGSSWPESHRAAPAYLFTVYSPIPPAIPVS